MLVNGSGGITISQNDSLKSGNWGANIVNKVYIQEKKEIIS